MNSLDSPVNLAILGLGASGLAAARLALAEGARVAALDSRPENAWPPDALAAAADLRARGALLLPDATALPPGIDFDEAVASPGLSPSSPLLLDAAQKGVPVVSELEYGWRRHRGRSVVVTGSNGKSSVVKALADLLGGVPCGNYGLPVCEAVAAAPAPGWLVIEASSFQLETVSRLAPDAAICLNLLPNHLDRHGTMEAYGRLKARIFARMAPGALALVPPELLADFQRWSGGRPRWETFGDASSAAAWRWSPGHLDGPGLPPPHAPSAPRLSGYFDNPVTGPAAAAVAAVATHLGVPAERIFGVLSAFVPLPHRNVLVAERGGIRWVDDSKATNLAALVAALQMNPAPVRLIAGGRPKETDFTAARPALAASVAAAYLIGEAAEAMARDWSPAVPCRLCGTLDAAVAAARADARPGDTVLLAPACTAFDQFASYRARGDAFSALATATASPDSPPLPRHA